jgi:hypothetical protein
MNIFFPPFRSARRYSLRYGLGLKNRAGSLLTLQIHMADRHFARLF